MAQRFSAPTLAVLVLALGLAAPPATAIADGSGCASVSASAVDQYCEMTPTATGGRVPSPSQEPVIATLPAAKQRALSRTPAGRLLARLPAPVRIGSSGRRGGRASIQPVTSTGARRASANVSPLSIGLPLIGLLVVLALGLIGTAAFGRSRRRSDS